MKVEDIEISDDLLHVIENNNFVIFAGAGVSMGEPTSLPSFESLVSEIGRYNGECEDKNGVSCEVRLGEWKRKGINVHGKASEILSRNKLKFNELHCHIVNIFKKNEDIRIITTNYDLMFEQYLESKNIKNVRTYSAPALPLGKDFNGIVHIHGVVEDTKSMVLTDEDFGKAYMTEQYVSRFLTDVFQSYDVIFIGYSYNDMIVEYLTKGMSPYKGKKRFIFTENNDYKFEKLGMDTVEFGNGQFDKLYKLIRQLGVINRRRLLEWSNIVNEFSYMPPTDIQLASEFEFCLNNPSKNIVLFSNIHGIKWFKWLEQRGVFDKISMMQENETENNCIKAINWLIDEFVGNNDTLLIEIIHKYNLQTNRYFIKRLIETIRNKEISNDMFSNYVMLVVDCIEHACEVYFLLSVAHDKKLLELEFILFKRLYVETVCVERKVYGDGFEVSIRLFAEKNLCKIAKKLINEDIRVYKPKEFLHFFKDKMDSIFEKVSALNRVDDINDPLLNYGFSLENNTTHNSDIVTSLMYLLETALSIVTDSSIDFSFKCVYITEFVESKYIFSRCIGLKMLRISESFTADEKCELLMKNESLYPSYIIKEQVYMLVGEIFNGLSDNNKKIVLDKIAVGPNKDNDDEDSVTSYAYSKYNWCIWLEKCHVSDNNLLLLKNSILAVYPDFEPRENPEKVVSFKWIDYSEVLSPKTVGELKDMDSNDFIHYIENYNDDFGMSQIKLYDTFCVCLEEDYHWGYGKIIDLLDKLNENKDLWGRILYKLPECNYSFKQHFQLIKLFVNNDTLLKLNDLQIGWYIKEIIKNKEYFIDIKNNAIDLFKIICTVIYKGKTIQQNNDNIYDKCLNSTFGVMLMSVIELLKIDNSNNEQYFEYFDSLLGDKFSENYDQVAFLLGGNLNNFYYYDLEWCKDNIIPLLTSHRNIEFANSWEGVSFFSVVLSEDIAKAFKEKYLDLINRINSLRPDGRSIFIKHFTLTMIYVIENPLLKDIPIFLEKCSSQDKKVFNNTIKNFLKNVDNVEKHNLWDRWLCKYWENRILSIPKKLNENEIKCMMNWCLYLGDLFPEALRIIESGMVINAVDEYYMHRLTTSDLMKEYPVDVAKLIIYMLNNSTNFTKLSLNYLSEICALDIPRELHDELKESLYKSGISLPK